MDGRRYMPIVFMKQRWAFWEYFSFQSPAVAPQRAHWVACFREFLQKITFSAGRDSISNGADDTRRRLLLKSPCHTARVKLLLEEFPDARFIYLHREPYTVFQSAANMADSTYWFTYLNTPSSEEVNEFIIEQFKTLHKECAHLATWLPSERAYLSHAPTAISSLRPFNSLMPAVSLTGTSRRATPSRPVSCWSCRTLISKPTSSALSRR